MHLFRRTQQRTYPWWHVLAEGLTAIVIGWLLVRAPTETILISLDLLGIYWLVTGLLTLVQLFSNEAEGRRRLLLLQGGLTVLVAVLILRHGPLDKALFPGLLDLLIGVLGVSIGLVGLLQAIKGGGLGAGLLGGMSLLFGLSVLGGSRASLTWLPWFIGVVAMIGGVISVLYSLRMRRLDPGDLSSSNPVLGVLRILAVLAITLVGVALIFLLSLLPIRRQGIRIHYWMTTWICRLVNRLLRIRVLCREPEKLFALRGILFLNHISFLDIPVAIAVLPMRFLSTSDVFQVPFVGWAAEAVSTVFVDRKSQDSRRDVRTAIAKRVADEPYPPFVIFPEGRFGTATRLRPFHYGSFEIAAQHSIPYLPCGLRYDRNDIALWKGVKTESFFAAAARVFSFRGDIHAELLPLTEITPTPSQPSAQLAQDAQRAVETALGFAPSEAVLLESEGTPEGNS